MCVPFFIQNGVLATLGLGRPETVSGSFQLPFRMVFSLVDVSFSFVNGALLAVAPTSLPNIASALRCWHRFVTDVLNMDATSTLPPLCDDHVILYTCIFRNSGTCKNYLSSLRFGCRVADVGFAWDTPRLQQALRGVAKRTVLAPKPRRRIMRHLMLALFKYAHSENNYEESCLYAFAFLFLFRLEKECLPLEVGTPLESESHSPSLPFGRHSSCWLEGNELVVRLRSRKNKMRGSTLRRACMCHVSPGSWEVCPVHVLGALLTGKAPGAPVFPFWHDQTGAAVRHSLRRRLILLGVPNATEFGLQSFRRGHAQQILDDGGTLVDVLRAGQWSSPAFLLYLDYAEVENSAVIDSWCFARGDESDDSE